MTETRAISEPGHSLHTVFEDVYITDRRRIHRSWILHLHAVVYANERQQTNVPGGYFILHSACTWRTVKFFSHLTYSEDAPSGRSTLRITVTGLACDMLTTFVTVKWQISRELVSPEKSALNLTCRIVALKNIQAVGHGLG